MIVVEGADNVGKTTLIRQLVERDPSLHLLHRRRYKAWNDESIADSYLDMLTPKDGDWDHHARGIADRCLASECIYGRLFRPGCRMTQRDHFLVKCMLVTLGALVVHCDPSDESVLATWREREQEYPADPLRIVRAYRERIVRLFAPIPVVRYDWSYPGSINADIQQDQILRRHEQILRTVLPVRSPLITRCREA